MLLLGFLLWAVLEVWVAALVAGEIGLGWTLVALLAVSVGGLVATRRQGRGAWRAIRTEAEAGRSPNRQVVDGLLILFGGLLLFLPGFVSGALGLLLLVPPVRTGVAAGLGALLWSRVTRFAGGGRFRVVSFGVGGAAAASRRWSDRRSGEVIDGQGWEVPPEGSRELPPAD